MAIIAASILNADFTNLKSEIDKVQFSGIDMFTLDVMDGHFVPNITFGDYVVARVREWTDLPMEVHLMADNPMFWIERMRDAGADLITFHLEATDRPLEVIDRIRACGLFVGIALNPETGVEEAFDFLGTVDLVNLLGVPTGFGGQAFIPETLDRIRALRKAIDDIGLPVSIEVDGGVKPSNISIIAEAGADILTVGTGIYHAPDPVVAVKELRENSAGERDQISRARAARLLQAVNVAKSRSSTSVRGLRNLRTSLDIPAESWAIVGEETD